MKMYSSNQIPEIQQISFQIFFDKVNRFSKLVISGGIFLLIYPM